MHGIKKNGSKAALMVVLAGLLLLVLLLSGLGANRPASAAPQACVPGPHSGVITSDEEWCLADSPHLISGDVTVSAGATVTIEAGAIVQGASEVELLVEGHLQAPGTPSLPITFTSSADAPGLWAGIAFSGGTGDLSYATVRYAGQRNSVTDAAMGHWARSNIAVRNVTIGEVRLDNVTISDLASTNQEMGVLVDNGNLVAVDSSFVRIGDGSVYIFPDTPLYIAGGDSSVTLTNNTFTANNTNSVVLQPGAMMNHDTTLTLQNGLDGYLLQDDFAVPSGITLSVEPGVVVQGPRDVELLVQGHLEALGTSGQSITFTSAADTGPTGWAGLAFDGGSGHLRYTTVRYSGDRNTVSDNMFGNPYHRSAVTLRDSTLNLEQVTLRDVASSDSNDHGLIVSNSVVTLTDTLFTGIGGGSITDGDFAAYVQGTDSVLEMHGNAFTGNVKDRVLLVPGAMMGHDTTLYAQPVFDGYELQADFTVPEGITLTVEPGLILRGSAATELLVRGHLQALGTPTQPITFTSSTDSGPYEWAGLLFDGSGGGGTGHLRHATIRHGGSDTSIIDGYHRGSNIAVYDVVDGEVRLEQVLLEGATHFDGWHFFGDHGLYVNNSHVAVVSSTIESNCDSGTSDSGVYVTGDSRVLIDDSLIHSNSAPGLLVEGDTAFVRVTGSSIVNNVSDGVRNTGAATVILSGDAESGNAIHANQGFGVNQEGLTGQTIATYNWWGDLSGPTHTGNPGGVGEEVTDRVIYAPWLTEPPAPPAINQDLVWTAAPNRASAGAIHNFGIYFQNILTETLTETLMVLELPWEANYLYSTGGGEYWPEAHRVQWKLGDQPPGATFAAAAQVQFKWGVPNGSLMRSDGNVAAGNLPSPYVAHPEQIAYEAVTVVTQVELNQGQVDGILAADAELNALFTHALGQGYEYFGNATQQAMSDGSERLTLLLMDRDRPGEMVAVRRIDADDRHIRHETPADISIYTLTGGARFILATAAWKFWGDMAAPDQATSLQTYDERFPFAFQATNACGPLDWGDCVRNCLVSNAPRPLLEDIALGGAKCTQCLACTSDCLDICSDCARDLWSDFHDERYKDCTRMCADSELRDKAKCEGPKQQCYAAEGMGPYGTAEYRLVFNCDSATCTYSTEPILEFCPYGCVYGQSGVTGVMTTDCEEVPCPIGGPLHDPNCIEMFTAKDPNAMYGPLVAAPGATITYTVECENVGEGTAYGVFITSELPPELDESTLQMTGGGTYWPGSRMLVWEIGELAPQTGDLVTFTAQVPSSTISGTLVTAGATVYFPSVPETTPTNPVVTIIEDVAAHNQQIETPEGVPADLTLTGSSPRPNPLSFSIIEDPLNGELSGPLPSLTYVPVVNFEGLDSFGFTVSDGVDTSRPALVSILVRPGADSTPPDVIYTVPANGADDVPVRMLPMMPDAYHPVIWLMFTEPISATTVTTDSFFVTDGVGGRVSGEVAYDGTRNVARFTPSEPLAWDETYTATITPDVQDTSGNPLAADYVWSFHTEESMKLYLPLILKQ